MIFQITFTYSNGWKDTDIIIQVLSHFCFSGIRRLPQNYCFGMDHMALGLENIVYQSVLEKMSDWCIKECPCTQIALGNMLNSEKVVRNQSSSVFLWK